jgi:cytidylate kinase
VGSAAYQPVVTVSATYGTGGSVVAPRLAEELGLPFVDRLISADESQDAWRAERARVDREGSMARPGPARPERSIPATPERSEEGLSEGEQAATPTGRFLSYFARAASVGVMIAPDANLEGDELIRERTEAGLRPIAEGAPAVVLGRAGAVILASRPRAFHVRLDGPVERRVAWAAGFEHLDLEAARRRQGETDRARTVFVKRLFRVDPSETRLYHLVLDPTVFGMEKTVQVLVTAARAFFAANPGA